jgi:glycosyltransferase involved in cell wall biosynthesis
MQSKKKILWQTHESNVSGANIAMLEYIDALANTFRFFVILPHLGNMQQALEQRNIAYAIIHQYGWTNVYPWWSIGKWMKLLLRSMAAVWQTKRLLKKENPAVVCTNTLVPFTASIAAKWQAVPHVWWIHEFGKEDFGFTIGWENEKLATKWIQESSRLIICNSKAVSVKFSQLMPKAKIATIYQPVSWCVDDSTEIFKKAHFVMFGQIIPTKGHFDVLEAMLSNKMQGKPLYTLHIKGPAEMKSYLGELQTFVAKNNLQQYVHIEAGYFRKEIIIRQYEVLIVASQAEAFGRVIVEANKAGLYVLVRKTGGAPELINESNGILFERQSELQAALCGEKEFPNGPIKLNYDESLEIERLTVLLNNLCR